MGNLKFHLIYILVCGLILPASAQERTDSIVEMTLKILQRRSGNDIKNMALTFTVTNHTDNDIYIPRLININRYEKQNGVWYILDPLNNRADTSVNSTIYQPVLKPRPGEDQKWYDKNYTPFLNFIKMQDSIKKKYLGLHADFFKDSYAQIFFLKAHQSLNDCIFLDCDNLLSRSMDYKFCIEPQKKLVLNPVYPAKIFEYNLFDPSKITSNTLYYSVTE